MAFTASTAASFTSPGGRDRIASSDAIRVRGSLRESECVESPPHPKPSLRYGFDLSPQAGRGEGGGFNPNSSRLGPLPGVPTAGR